MDKPTYRGEGGSVSDIIPIAKINLSGGTQSRTTLDQDTINDYRDAMQTGAQFPPVTVFYDGEHYWLADGFHRVHAHIMRRRENIEADVRQGTYRDAVLFSVGANSSHGLRRTNADKRRAVQRLLDDEEWSRWSDREIARRCGVDNSFVSRLRKEVAVDEPQSERIYTTKYGAVATMRTVAIGKPATSPVMAVQREQSVDATVQPAEAQQAAVERPVAVRIGDAIIYQADCRDVLPLLASVSHILTDPPYEADAHRQGRVTNAAINKGEDATLAFDAITEALRTYVAEQATRLSQGWFLAFCQAEGVYLWRQAIEQAQHRYRGPAVWVKPDGSPKFQGNGPSQSFEMLVTSWCGSGDSKWNSKGKRGVYTHPVNVDRHGGHQTEKPLPLLRELLLDFTEPGDTVLDPFMGIGSLGVACLELGRKYIGVEMDAGYFEIARKRISGIPANQSEPGKAADDFDPSKLWLAKAA
jgi:site-specific DNA-methyltransferase (adenine-specific)